MDPKYNTPENLAEIEERLRQWQRSGHSEAELMADFLIDWIAQERGEGQTDMEIIDTLSGITDELLTCAKILRNEIVPKRYKVVFLSPYAEWEDVLAFSHEHAKEKVGIPPEVDNAEPGTFLAHRTDGDDDEEDLVG